jgi:hypothetical protein
MKVSGGRAQAPSHPPELRPFNVAVAIVRPRLFARATPAPLTGDTHKGQIYSFVHLFSICLTCSQASCRIRLPTSRPRNRRSAVATLM